MNEEVSGFLLIAGTTGLILAGIIRALPVAAPGLLQAVTEGLVLIVVSLAGYRFLARRSFDQ